jgi:hypothetical protein
MTNNIFEKLKQTMTTKFFHINWFFHIKNKFKNIIQWLCCNIHANNI